MVNLDNYFVHDCNYRSTFSLDDKIFIAKLISKVVIGERSAYNMA